MTAATPLARYSAVEGALASGFANAELHHSKGRDRVEMFLRYMKQRRGQTRRFDENGRPVRERPQGHHRRHRERPRKEPPGAPIGLF